MNDGTSPLPDTKYGTIFAALRDVGVTIRASLRVVYLLVYGGNVPSLAMEVQQDINTVRQLEMDARMPLSHCKMSKNDGR